MPNDDVCGIGWKKIWLPFLILLISMYSFLMVSVDYNDLYKDNMFDYIYFCTEFITLPWLLLHYTWAFFYVKNLKE